MQEPALRKRWFIMLSKCVVGMKKTERQNGSCPVDRAKYKELKMVRSELMWMACLPPRAIVLFGLGLLPRVLSGPMALPQPWSVLLSLAPVTTEGRG